MGPAGAGGAQPAVRAVAAQCLYYHRLETPPAPTPPLPLPGFIPLKLNVSEVGNASAFRAMDLDLGWHRPGIFQVLTDPTPQEATDAVSLAGVADYFTANDSLFQVDANATAQVCTSCRQGATY